MLVPSTTIECVSGLPLPQRPVPGVRPSGGPAVPAFSIVLKRHWWKALLFVLVCSAGAYFLSLRMKPMYETTASVEVDYQQPTGVIGIDSEKPFPSNDTDEFLGTQAKLVQSDNVLRPVANRYGLLALENQIGGVDARSDESVTNAPVTLKRLKVSRQPNTQLLLISYRAPVPKLAADVANDIANSYIQRVYALRSASSASLSHFMESQLGELKSRMENSGQRLVDFERAMGVINPADRTSLISARLLQLDTVYTQAQAERQRKEAAYEAMKGGSIEAAQVSAQGDALAKVSDKLLAAKEILASTQAVYGPNHPEFRRAQSEVDELTRQMEDTKNNIARRIETDYRQALAREAMLSRSIDETREQFDKTNSNLAGYQQLKRDAEDDRVMYSELLRKVRESSINASFQNHNIRIADEARPPFKPVTPNVPFNVMAAGLLSSFLALGCLIALGAMDNTLRSTVQTSQRLNVSVLGALPMVKGLAKMAPQQSSSALAKSGRVLAFNAYQESIRKVRNAIVLARDFAGVRSVLITSAAAGEGKSVTAADLARCCVQQQRRILLIDADLRRPTLHLYFNIDNVIGLGEILSGEVDGRSTMVSPPEVPGLSIITAGNVSRPAGDLIGPLFHDLLEKFRGEFDLIIVDAPPMLAFAEPVQVASNVDAVVLVVRAGKTTAPAAEMALSTLQWAGANVLGVVLNQVRESEAGHCYSYYGGVNSYGQGLNHSSAAASRG
jgi:polysaccharide biosynthesis transport protein